VKITLVLAAAALGSGCKGDPVRCAVDADCLQGGAPGFCLGSPKSDERWCAFSDPRCAAGYRWGVLSGDGLEDVCLPDDHPRHALTVGTRGSGSGTIVSVPSGIDFGVSCTAHFPAGVTVTLTASATDGTKPFLGWSGACTGRDACSVTLDADQSVSALFAAPGEALWVKQLGGAGTELLQRRRDGGEWRCARRWRFQRACPVRRPAADDHVAIGARRTSLERRRSHHLVDELHWGRRYSFSVLDRRGLGRHRGAQ
jgi:hypothetical protein